MEKLEIVPFSEIIEQDWSSFHEACSDPVLFYQYPFLSAYEKSTEKKVTVVVYKKDNKILMALPGIFDKRKNKFFNLSYLGWDNLNFLMDREVTEHTLQIFFTELFKTFQLIVYKNISQSCYQIITKYTAGPVAFKKFKCPYVHLPQLYNDYLESLSVSFKRMLKNRTNFCEKHGVSFVFLSNSHKDLLPAALIDLNRLHKLRMTEMSMESKFLKPDSQAFHEIIQGHSSNPTLIIQALRDEAVIGTLYGFISANRFVYFAAGIDPRYSKYSLGVVLIGKMMDYLIVHNFRYFDFLRGTEDYKFKWTKEIDQNYTVYSFNNALGKFKAMTLYWKQNKFRIGRKKTLNDLRRFLYI
ncbi:GNAT family N-acetyltransferase [Formosa sp. PL04]|uniref:GNAT family N-acetyltransferase n=1 Tax=Formosa sp. PL04 TaxID=3081755 RepID=UPI0029828DCE|nr:GNAT family N-acetyltransferase [Formosa sp. PL04]MDW5290742.1 GNAT family N-acetyltransferase [Formosa sp. PL04]